jgi:hypothetical protein
MNELVARLRAANGRWYEIKRSGQGKKEGGVGIVWSCDCGSGSPHAPRGRALHECVHLKALWRGHVTESQAEVGKRVPVSSTDYVTGVPITVNKYLYLVELTPLGEELLRARWAAAALRKP